MTLQRIINWSPVSFMELQCVCQPTAHNVIASFVDAFVERDGKLKKKKHHCSKVSAQYHLQT